MSERMKAAEQTLIDQMGFSDREIARRLHLLNFTEFDAERLKLVKETIKNVTDDMVEAFYVFQLSDPEIAQAIGDIDTLTRLKGYMKSYIQSLFTGCYDEKYVNTRLRIGKVHKRLDVRPKLYMKAHAKLQSLLDQEIEESCFVEDAILIKQALHKILLFDAELVFDAYIEAYMTEMQSVTREVEKYASQVGIRVDSMFNRLHERSQRDQLTGLHNRRSLFDLLSYECRVAERHNLSFVLIYLDLNGFKSVNDLHGHHAGDEVLVQVGQSLMATTRSVDIPSRYGGDEFCIVFPRISLLEIEAIISRLVEDFDVKCKYPVTFSMGIVQVGPKIFETPEELIKIADGLMYKAKERAHRDGKHHWEFEGKS
ncbi:GGDEF domain-containing protein [Sneathiella sp.]|uniref:GGDEF domain-containing protein n=1 Tax=Sneathiella sp. TaxID=1964365 RepID=UPI0039E56FBE